MRLITTNNLHIVEKQIRHQFCEMFKMNKLEEPERYSRENIMMAAKYLDYGLFVEEEIKTSTEIHTPEFLNLLDLVRQLITTCRHFRKEH